jgi:inner membrane protein
MTGRTHDLAAFTALVAVFVLIPEAPKMTVVTAITAFGANFVGGLFPDIDQKNSDFWDNFRLGPFVAKIMCPLFGGHRNFSHSLLGMLLIGFLSKALLYFGLRFLTFSIDPLLVWYAFMIGVISHVIMDMPTKAGVPLLWPLKLKVGIPPFRALRFESGTFIENWIVFPGLVILTGYLLFTHQERVLSLF